MSLKAGITRDGAILLGKYVACDGFDKARPLRVVTHVHADHMLGLRRSLRNCEKVLMTPATKDLISVLKGPLFLMGGDVKTLDYEKPFQYKDETITFYPADHILGSAQVLVKDLEGNRILYTSDFRIDKTPIVDCDFLVIEATYGSPRCVRNFDQTAEEVLVRLVEKILEDGAVHVFGYHGKLQEVMEVLWENGVKVPYIVPERVFQVCKIYERYGKNLGRYWLARSEFAKNLAEKNEPHIGFYHMSSRRFIGDEQAARIIVSGWEFHEVCRQIGEKEYTVTLSDHSDFEGLLEYVRRCKPKLVLTDNFRVGYARVLAKEIRKRFGIEAMAVPVKKPKNI